MCKTNEPDTHSEWPSHLPSSHNKFIHAHILNFLSSWAVQMELNWTVIKIQMITQNHLRLKEIQVYILKCLGKVDWTCMFCSTTSWFIFNVAMHINKCELHLEYSFMLLAAGRLHWSRLNVTTFLKNEAVCRGWRCCICVFHPHLIYQITIPTICGQISTIFWLINTIALYNEAHLHSEDVTGSAYSLVYHRHTNSSGTLRARCLVKIQNAVISIYGREGEREEERGRWGRFQTTQDTRQPLHILAKLNYSQCIFVYFKLKIER